jgi:hypothetical protein
MAPWATFKQIADISDRGNLVGRARDDSTASSWLYRDGHVIALPGTLASVVGISPNGKWFVGGTLSGPRATISDGTRVWTADIPGAYASFGTDVNNHGVAIGTYIYSRTSDDFGIIFDRQGVTLLAGASTPGSGSFPAAINTAGDVVGARYGAGFIARNGVVHDLANLIPAADREHWSLGSALFINKAGQIAGQGTFNGAEVHYLLTPVPEPSALALLPLGLAVQAAVRRRRCLSLSTTLGPPRANA